MKGNYLSLTREHVLHQMMRLCTACSLSNDLCRMITVLLKSNFCFSKGVWRGGVIKINCSPNSNPVPQVHHLPQKCEQTKVLCHFQLSMKPDYKNNNFERQNEQMRCHFVLLLLCQPAETTRLRPKVLSAVSPAHCRCCGSEHNRCC